MRPLSNRPPARPLLSTHPSTPRPGYLRYPLLPLSVPPFLCPPIPLSGSRATADTSHPARAPRPVSSPRWGSWSVRASSRRGIDACFRSSVRPNVHSALSYASRAPDPPGPRGQCIQSSGMSRPGQCSRGEPSPRTLFALSSSSRPGSAGVPRSYRRRPDAGPHATHAPRASLQPQPRPDRPRYPRPPVTSPLVSPLYSSPGHRIGSL